MELPLRMVAAGTGVKTALSLFVISEGRYQTQNFPNTTVPMTQVLWNFGSSSSNYSELRLDALAENDGHVWLTSYARKGVLFTPVRDGISPAFDVSYVGPSYAAATLAEAYAQQGLANGETTVLDCLAAFDAAQTFTGSVIDTCDDFGNCTDAPAGQMAAHELACGPLDDLAAGLVGMHPVDVWITRLEAELPRVSLADDLVLEAADDQLTVENRVIGDAEDDPCFGMAVPRSGRPGIRLPPGGFVTLFFAAAALVAMRRRFRRVRAEPAGGRLAARGAAAAT
jgi:hypothetical protein